MAKRNRSARRNVPETEENPVNNVAENEAADQEAENVENVAAEENLNNAAAAGAAAGVAAGAAGAPVGLEAVLGLLVQVLARLPIPNIPPPVINVEQVVNEEDVLPAPRNPSYLKVLDHMQKLGTKFFVGGSRPMEANQWLTRLERNFDSIRCPDAYKKDIAVHYLDGDAHTWWQGVVSQDAGRVFTWPMFCVKFRAKYFTAEMFAKLEGEFLKLEQGTMTVREYEAEFNRLKKYAG